MIFLDDWHDWLRLLNMSLCVACCVHLIKYAIKKHKRWINGYFDEWTIWFVWCLAGVEISIEGILRDSPFSYRPLVVFVAAALTARAIFLLDRWKYPDV